MRRGNTMAWALGVSAVVHLLFFAGMAALAAMNAFASRISLDSWQIKESEDVPKEILLVAEKEPASMDTQEFIRTDVAQASDRPPERSRFLSDRDTQAASVLPPEPGGEKNAPTQDGIDVPVIEIVAQELADGDDPDAVTQTNVAPQPDAQSSAESPAPAEAAQPSPAAASKTPPLAAETPAPQAPISSETVATTSDSDTVVTQAKPETPRESPPSLREPALDVQVRPPEPRPTPPNDSRPRETPANNRATEKPVPSRFQAHRALTKLRGTISNNGASSVDAADTPIGRYMKEVTSAIEREWHRKRRHYADFVTYGTIRLDFFVNKRGKVEGLSIKNRNGANAIMQDFTLNAVLDARIPPMPADLPEILDHDRLPITYDIIVY